MSFGIYARAFGGITRCVAFVAIFGASLILLGFGHGQKVSAQQQELEKATQNSQWPHPELNDGNLRQWSEFVWPTESELAWQKVRWHIELADAQEEARKLQRPILLWTMNGHPCGET